MNNSNINNNPNTQNNNQNSINNTNYNQTNNIPYQNNNSYNQNNFNNMYGDIANEEWCIISSDGKWMKLDTNPYDEDGDYVNRTFYEDIIEPCAEKIQRVNRDLGFKSSIYSEMCETTSDDGYQTESNDKYTVSWSFHPDKGLEVIYEINS